MRAATRWRALGLAALAAASVAAVRSPSLRAQVRAGYRAFRDPSLLDPPPPPAPVTVSCARFAADAERRDASLLDADLSRSLDRPLPEDLDDPEGATIATLTLPDLRVPITRRTMRYVRFLGRTEAGRAAFLQRHRRAGLYREGIAFALREAGLPEDLLWLAAVESGFDPRAVSPAGAAGLWQFMPETAQLYGLDQSPFVDERRSIARATHAAVTHLRDLYERFGRWDLALAAYNAGYDRVAGAVEKLSGSRATIVGVPPEPVTFADLAAARALPEETIQYVPQIMAFALVAANRSRFGLDAPELGAPLELGEIAVPEGTRLRTVARAAGVSVAVLRDYNPQILRDRVPPVGGDYLISLPEARVQRALATFPSYGDQEVLAENDGDGPRDELRDVAPPVAEGFALDTDADDPLPRRPTPLGKNRLPELSLPRRGSFLMAAGSFGAAMLEAKLPMSLAMPDLGTRHPYAEDSLGLLTGVGRDGSYRLQTLGGPASGDSAVDKQLGFLSEARPVEALRTFALPSGIIVRVRRDRGATTTAITVRIATVEEPGEGTAPAFRLARRGAELGASETLHTITVDRSDVDAAIEIAASRLRLALGDTEAAQLAEIRFHAGDARRRALESQPYGQSWLTLGETLFPPDHPLAGTVLGAGDDSAALRDMMIAEAMRREHALARASLTIVGDVDEARAHKLAEAFLAPVGAPADALVAAHPREDRVTVEEEVPSPRALLGWIGPGEGEVGDASLRVAVEMLESQRVGILQHALVERGLASLAYARLEVWPRAAVAAVELSPAPGHDVAEVLRALDAELGRLGGEGPEAGQVAVAKFLLHARLQKEEAAATSTATSGAVGGRDGSLPGAVHSAGLLKLRHALRPWAGERTLKALDDVSVASVRAAVKRILAREHRVVVTTVPRSK